VKILEKRWKTSIFHSLAFQWRTNPRQQHPPFQLSKSELRQDWLNDEVTPVFAIFPAGI
jgi:hypothetical protein